ncbi:MAG: phenylalanine--tRNA ligase subunit alpha [Candidatus Diapherotrites archaeon]|nr:phenylalanine--tRNA ligase subunit alpha [Candidatus Diapherotrites archaeon]
MEEIARKLSSHEVTVLRVLSEEPKTVEEVSKETGLPEAAVMRALSFLERKGLALTEKKTIHYWDWTEKGRYYSSNPLPERRLLELLKEREEVDLSEAKELLGDELGPALGLLKKEGLAKIEKGKIVLLRYIPSFPWEESIRTLEGEGLELLQKRGLVTRRKRSIIRARITPRGKEVRNLKVDLLERLTPEILRSGEWKGKELRAYDVESPVPKKHYGSKHPYVEFLRKIKDVLISMGFEEMEYSSPVIPHFWDLEVLFVPQDHPSADLGAADTFLVETPSRYGEIKEKELYEKVKEVHERVWGYKWSDEVARRLVLRSHATVLSALTLRNPKVPGKYFTISRVYRPEQVDAKHLPEFNQLDGIVLDESLDFRHLLGLLKNFAEVFVGTGNVRFKAGYFPFTEPSVEMFVKHPELGWIEIGGAGIFREELLEPFGIEVPVIAWGLGLERFFMVRYGISDIRDLFTENLDRLRSIPKVWRL